MPRPDRREFRFWQVPVPSFSTWTVGTIRAVLAEHEQGYFQNSALLAEAMERNPRIKGALETRVLGVQGLPFKLTDSPDGHAQRAPSVTARAMALWPEIAPKETLGELLRWAVLLGVAFAEVIWTTTGGAWVPRLRAVHPTFVSWDVNARRFRVETLDGPEWIEPGDSRWAVFGYSSERPWMRGVVRCLGLPDNLRGNAVRDWARWSEKHGLPIMLAKVPSDAPEPDKDRYFADLSSLGSESTVMAPQAEKDRPSFGAELLEPKDAAWEGFERFVASQDADTAIAIVGQTLTTEVKGGSLAAAKVHDRVRGDYLEADAGMIDSGTRRQVWRPWALYNHGDERLAPVPQTDASVPEDRAAIADAWAKTGTAVRAWIDAGANVDIKAAAERAGMPLVAGQELLPKSALEPTGTNPAQESR
jgi:phage gp29-like protein